MKKMKPHFVYNKRQRNGVFYFLLLIVCLQGVYFYLSHSSELKSDDDIELSQLRNQLDSFKQQKVSKQQKASNFNFYKFNPNFITDEKGYLLGMSVKEIDRLLEFRASNKWIQSANHFQEVTQVSDSLLIQLKPLFLFPVFEKKKKAKRKKVKSIVLRDINSATSNELKQVKGIGDKLSERIIKYRNKLGGYTFMNQLDEVWGLSDEALLNVKSEFKVFEKPQIEKININTASFKEILSIVYIDYDLTKRLFRYKDSVGEILDLKEIKKIASFPDNKYDRIALYLQAE